MSSTEPGARERRSPASPFLFSEIPLEGTLEELGRVYRRRKETAGTLGEEGLGQRLDEAYAVARTCLEAALDEAHAPGSSLLATGSSDDPVVAESETRSEGALSGGASDARNAEEPPASFPSDSASGSA